MDSEKDQAEDGGRYADLPRTKRLLFERHDRRERKHQERFERERERAATQWLKSLPEFRGSDDVRIREVFEQLLQWREHPTVVPGQDIGNTAPQTPRGDAEGLGR
jgi:hypothetical protein